MIVVKSKQPGSRTRVTACAYSPDGKTIAAACQDGAVHTWSTSSNFARPSSTVEKAHLKDTATSGIAFSHDGKSLVTRGGDDCVKSRSLPSLSPVSRAGLMRGSKCGTQRR